MKTGNAKAANYNCQQEQGVGGRKSGCSHAESG